MFFNWRPEPRGGDAGKSSTGRGKNRRSSRAGGDRSRAVVPSIADRLVACRLVGIAAIAPARVSEHAARSGRCSLRRIRDGAGTLIAGGLLRLPLQKIAHTTAKSCRARRGTGSAVGLVHGCSMVVSPGSIGCQILRGRALDFDISWPSVRVFSLWTHHDAAGSASAESGREGGLLFSGQTRWARKRRSPRSFVVLDRRRDGLAGGSRCGASPVISLIVPLRIQNPTSRT